MKRILICVIIAVITSTSVVCAAPKIKYERIRRDVSVSSWKDDGKTYGDYTAYCERIVRIKYSRKAKVMKARLNTAKKKMPKWIKVYLKEDGKKIAERYHKFRTVTEKKQRRKGYVKYMITSGVGVRLEKGKVWMSGKTWKVKEDKKYEVYARISDMKRYKKAAVIRSGRVTWVNPSLGLLGV